MTNSPTADWIARQITEASPWDAAPGYLIRDRDCLFGSIVRHRVCAMGIRDKPIAPRSPWQNGFARAPDWVPASRMPGPDHCLGRGALHRNSALLRELLQQSSDAPVTQQRRAGAVVRIQRLRRPKFTSCSSMRLRVSPIRPKSSLRLQTAVTGGLDFSNYYLPLFI